MRYCYVNGCSHQAKRDACSFFTIPRDSEIQKQWLKAIRRDSISTKNARICSCHFKDGQKGYGPTLFSYNNFGNVSFKTVTWPYKLLVLMKEMQKKGFLCDVKIVTSDNKTLLFHGLILAAASPVLSEAIQNERKSETTGITIRSGVRSDVWQPLVTYLYTGVLKVKPDIYDDFLYLVDQLDIQQLRSQFRNVQYRKKTNSAQREGRSQRLRGKDKHLTKFDSVKMVSGFKRKKILENVKKEIKNKRRLPSDTAVGGKQFIKSSPQRTYPDRLRDQTTVLKTKSLNNNNEIVENEMCFEGPNLPKLFAIWEHGCVEMISEKSVKVKSESVIQEEIASQNDLETVGTAKVSVVQNHETECDYGTERICDARNQDGVTPLAAREFDNSLPAVTDILGVVSEVQYQVQGSQNISEMADQRGLSSDVADKVISDLQYCSESDGILAQIDAVIKTEKTECGTQGLEENTRLYNLMDTSETDSDDRGNQVWCLGLDGDLMPTSDIVLTDEQKENRTAGNADDQQGGKENDCGRYTVETVDRLGSYFEGHADAVRNADLQEYLDKSGNIDQSNPGINYYQTQANMHENEDSKEMILIAVDNSASDTKYAVDFINNEGCDSAKSVVQHSSYSRDPSAELNPSEHSGGCELNPSEHSGGGDVIKSRIAEKLNIEGSKDSGCLNSGLLLEDDHSYFKRFADDTSEHSKQNTISGTKAKSNEKKVHSSRISRSGVQNISENFGQEQQAPRFEIDHSFRARNYLLRRVPVALVTVNKDVEPIQKQDDVTKVNQVRPAQNATKSIPKSCLVEIREYTGHAPGPTQAGENTQSTEQPSTPLAQAAREPVNYGALTLDQRMEEMEKRTREDMESFHSVISPSRFNPIPTEETLRNLMDKNIIENIHSGLHCPDRSTLCSICGKSYPNPSSMKTHLKHVHPTAEERLARSKVCDVCGKIYSAAYELNRHKRKNHGAKTER